MRRFRLLSLATGAATLTLLATGCAGRGSGSGTLA
jgi:hypothetical protein